MRVGIVLALSATLIVACASIAGLDSVDPDGGSRGGDDDDASSNGSTGKTGTSSGQTGTSGAPGTSSGAGTSGGTSSGGTSSGSPVDSGVDVVTPPTGDCIGPDHECPDDKSCNEDMKCHALCSPPGGPCITGQNACCFGESCKFGLPFGTCCAKENTPAGKDKDNNPDPSTCCSGKLKNDPPGDKNKCAK